MRSIEDARLIEGMRDVLRRCERLIGNFSDMKTVNIPQIMSRVKSVSKDIDLPALMSDIKKYAANEDAGQ